MIDRLNEFRMQAKQHGFEPIDNENISLEGVEDDRHLIKDYMPNVKKAII